MQPLIMTPGPGERLVRFVGDQLSFRLSLGDGNPLPEGWQARLRTNIGRGETLRREILCARAERFPLGQASWRDVPMRLQENVWTASFSLIEPGFFKAKAYAIDTRGRQFWPDGPDAGVSVHPDGYRTGNTIYCAFARMFGESRKAQKTTDEKLETVLSRLDADGYTVIPPSGKLRDVIAMLPHIIDTLGCRILHLLPVNPVPTTYARFGRFGSPYAVQDLLAIDPALVEFDKRTTGVDQFRELTYAVHARGAKVFLDVVINHTGWGSSLQENHPEWFVRDPQGDFLSPGAWGVVWEDLVEMDHRNPDLWEHVADTFLEWCRRGVDGFRCDAGYKIPVPAWRYITARVQQEFPDTIFLLEGLGGSWEATEQLLTEGGMQWAYSELFQNYSREQISGYLDYALAQSQRVGIYVHYSETHDNDRLAKQGREWSLLRNRLCALTSVSGGFGFTCGVEWLAPEKLQVHQCRGLAWGDPKNIVNELARVNRLLLDHPCFFDNATLTRLSAPNENVYALSRVSAEGKDHVLVLINTDLKARQSVRVEGKTYEQLGSPGIDLLGQTAPVLREAQGGAEFELEGGACFCLAVSPTPRGWSGDRYREARAQAAWAITQIGRRIRVRSISPFEWTRMAELVEHGPAAFLGAVSHLDPALARQDVIAALEQATARRAYPPLVIWRVESRNRITVVPHDHWLLVEDAVPFRAILASGTAPPQHAASIRVGKRHLAAFLAGLNTTPGDAQLTLERYEAKQPQVTAPLRFLELPKPITTEVLPSVPAPDSIVLLTNGRGAMARMGVDLGKVQSKYDCVLAANLNAQVPVDRHVFAKRARMWLNADGFTTALDARNLAEFTPGPPARWRFIASAGDDRTVEIVLTADMLEERNTTVLRFERPMADVPVGRDLPSSCKVALTVRVDIEDRNFHSETHHNGGADHHFNANISPLSPQVGFLFRPANDRQLRVFSDGGAYYPQGEWSDGVPHPIEASRGQVDRGDAFSPGWFELPLAKGQTLHLVLTAEPADVSDELRHFDEHRQAAVKKALHESGYENEVQDPFGASLARAVRAFVVRRGQDRTVIAGYPWFLDWGRDSLICARGLIAAGMLTEVKQLLRVFGRFEQRGTLPNTIHGDDASNRDTSDAPLWYGVVCEELAEVDPALYNTAVDAQGLVIREVLRRIALGYRNGTPNGIRMDPASALIWSPSHFTWMDTNYPAGTPREGYPVEIQVLWIRLLRQLARIDSGQASEWAALANQAEASFLSLFWLEKENRLSDLLIARAGQSAREARADNALRSNSMFAVSLGVLTGPRAWLCVEAALQYLVVPGALRSLAPLPVSPPLPVQTANGHLLNLPSEPYWGRYEGDEDSRRKPAYHNGTAWTWTLPSFCEALARAWDFEPTAVQAARHYLASMEALLHIGCLGQLPEVLDGDAPHRQRGCDAQAWGATEALRVWKLLLRHLPPPGSPTPPPASPPPSPV